MAKRARAGKDSKSRDRHCSIDRISKLPDKLLVYILSFMTLKERTVTSILSRRWSYLWTFTSKLDFDGTESLLKLEFGEGEQDLEFGEGEQDLELLLNKEREKYVKWVNYGIASCKDSTIEEFRVFFNLTKTHKIDIDKWLTYALAKKVQKLELNLTDDACTRSRQYDECYSFPYELLHSEKGNFSIGSQSSSMGQCDSVDFKNLKRISMNYVNVNGEALEFFLHNCSLLEDLFVRGSGELSSLKITGPLPLFKRLEIDLCHNLTSIEIRDANLVYLKYKGSRINFLLDNVPLLVEIFIGGMLTDHMEDARLMFSSCLPQLEILTIDRWDLLSWKETRMFSSGVKMSKLKQLRVKVCIIDDRSLLPLINLICASPCLERFVLEASHLRDQEIFKNNVKIDNVGASYVHLKQVVFLGYRGVINELELVMHFVKNAAALEKILIDPRMTWETPYENLWNYKWERNIKDEMDARTRAKQQLIEEIPSRINLEIL